MGGIGSGRDRYVYRKGRVTEFPSVSTTNLRGHDIPKECVATVTIGDVSCSVTITSTGQHFGGARRWFRCTCGRRCAKLYLRERALRCRTCSNLSYPTQSMTRMDRYTFRAEKLWARVAYDDGDGWHMPLPRIRQATFDRIADLAQRYDAASSRLGWGMFERIIERGR